ncbi:MAG: transposase [Prevotella bivia]|nr:transposase [Prevotella bivia]
MKSNLKYKIISDTMYQTPDGLMEVRILVVTLTKKQKGDTDIVHQARIITFVNTTKKAPKQISLLTNDMELDPNDIILIYRKRWEIELLFKQLKQNFPLRSLIANLLLCDVLKRLLRIHHRCRYSGNGAWN